MSINRCRLSRRNWVTLIPISILTLVPVVSVAQCQKSDALDHGGDILTMRDDSPELDDAQVVRNGRIAFVGSSREATQVLKSVTNWIYLAGTTLLPGFIDNWNSIVECH